MGFVGAATAELFCFRNFCFHGNTDFSDFIKLIQSKVETQNEQEKFRLFHNKVYSILQIVFCSDCKIGMHYIYIHRYTINYNKVREACLSAGLSLSLLPSG